MTDEHTERDLDKGRNRLRSEDHVSVCARSTEPVTTDM